MTIAKKTGIPMARLILFEYEEANPSPEELEAIAAALGTTVEAINAVQD